MRTTGLAEADLAVPLVAPRLSRNSRTLQTPDDLPREQRDAFNLRKMGTFRRARMRIPALVVTLLVELLVAFVISGYAETGIFKRYPLLIAFQPVISAISGNVGLQSASINVRDLAVGSNVRV